MADGKKFPCVQCGECCRHIDLVPELAKYDRGDGVCAGLQGNLCGIYENRPLICRVDEAYERRFRGEYTREEFIRMNLEACRKLMQFKEK